MPPFPAPAAAAAELCLAMLLLALLLAASSAADAINTTTSSSCEPAKCGNLTIGYPFWLAGTHPPECGYQAFQVSCQQGKASLKNGFWTYQIMSIFYERSSFRVRNTQLSEDSCIVESLFNTSSDLSFGPFNICSVNQELFFLYNCKQSRLQLPSSWASISCANNHTSDSYAWLAGHYKPDDAWKPLPGNCTVSMMPVLGYAGATAKDYERLIKGGFRLNYMMRQDDCKDCSESGGRCQVNVTYDLLECHCPDGLSQTRFCRHSNNGRRIILIAKSCRAQESKISMIGARGTIGFIAPEVMYKTFGVVSTKSDVYSYGMMLLEMVGGRRNVRSMVEKSSEKYFPDWIYDHFALDDGLKACEVTSEFEQIAKRMTLIGLWCVQVLPMHRPTITQALDMFDRSLDELEMPPKQNFLELLEHPVHRLSEESTSFTRHTNATEALSDVLKVEETSLVNLKNLDMTTNSAKR